MPQPDDRSWHRLAPDRPILALIPDTRPDIMLIMTDTKKSAPAPLVSRVRKSEAATLAAGGRRLPNGMLKPSSAQALDALLAAGYAPSATACIARALIEAAGREGGIAE